MQFRTHGGLRLLGEFATDGEAIDIAERPGYPPRFDELARNCDGTGKETG